MIDSGQTRLHQEAMAQFERLIDLDQAARDAELQRLGRESPLLHARLRRLLDADHAADAGSFLEGDAEASLRRLGSFSEPAASALQPGAAFGVYRLLRPLGSGGMGEVWLAARADGHYEGQVAIKTLRAFLTQPGARERFAREGRILGRLQHPHIARLLDAGVADDGQLYLVLEYIDGEHLTAWCDARRLSVAARLQLFLQICDAVAHAHAQLVVHRDLKPSNILVTAAGEPKLLDFGIAKLIESDADGAQTELTRAGGRALTPEYAAPEQILGEPVSTATDVYALGVLLYELLCGLRPHSGAGSTAQQIERAVIETDARPLTQSTLRREAGERATPAQRAARRGMTPRGLCKTLRGDLDNILLKALQREPSRRYAAVSAFSDDLRRHLAHEPVTARPDALAYRAGKFLRRYRVGVAAAAAILLALGAGLGAALWQAQLARVQARKAEAVKEFLLAIFQQNSANHPDGASARNTTAAELLEVGTQRIRSELGDLPETRAELLTTLGRLYYELTLPEPALAMQQEAVDTLRQAFGDDDLRTITATVRLGASLSEAAGRFDEGVPMLQQSLTRLDASGRGQTDTAALAAQLLGQWAYRTRPATDPAARQYFQRALGIYRQQADSVGDQIVCWQGLARVAEYAGDLAGAERGYREALKLAVQSPESRVAAAGTQQQFGDLLRKQQRFEEAESSLRDAVRLYQEAAGDDSAWTLDARRELGNLLSIVGRRAEGIAMLDDVVRRQTRLRGADDPLLTNSARFDYAAALYAHGRFEAAAHHFGHALRVWRAEDAQGANLAVTMARYGSVLLAQGKLDAAASLLTESLTKIEAAYGSGSRTLASARVRVADSWLLRGEPQRAADEFARVLASWPAADNSLPAHWLGANLGLIDAALKQGDTAAAQQRARSLVERIEGLAAGAAWFPDEESQAQAHLGRALLQAGAAEAAVAPLRRALALRESLDDPASPWLADTRVRLAQALLQMGQREQAQALCAAAESAYDQHADLSDAFLAPLRELRSKLRSRSCA